MSLNDLSFKFLDQQVNTLFIRGKTFRSFKELNIAGNTVYVVRIEITKPILFTGFEIAIESGQLKVETVAGGTASGTFSETFPIIKTNLMYATSPAASVGLTAGGSHTGGTVIDVVRQKTDGNATRATSVIQSDPKGRGIAPGLYYWRFINLGADPVVGTVKIHWEEP